MATTRPAQLAHRFLIAVLLAVASVVALPPMAGAAVPGETLGVYAGAGDPSAVARFEAQIGRPVAVVHDALARENWANLSNPTWFAGQWTASPYRQRVVYTVPMLPDSGGTLAEGARGAYNMYFRTLALRLVAGGEGSAILRIGPEFNGNWFRWSITAPNGAADFAAFWRQIVDTMRAVPGANFKFDWCPNGGSSWVAGQQLQAESAYPGDAYVDYVGLDVYDQSWGPNRADPAARWKELVTTRNGLAWQRDFARAHGKPMTFPEWGLANRTDGYGGGDSPHFIEQMYEWIRTNDVAYHMYFEYGDSVADYALFNGWAPNASRRFVELFGGGSTGAPPPPSPSDAVGGGSAASPAPAAVSEAGGGAAQHDPAGAAGAVGPAPASSPPPSSAGSAPAKAKTRAKKRAQSSRCIKKPRRGRASRRSSRTKSCARQQARSARARRTKTSRRARTHDQRATVARRTSS